MKSYKLIGYLMIIILGFGNSDACAQMSRIESTIPKIEAESHLRFLAADELRGRNTGTLELNIAGRYIAEQFRKFGVTPLGDESGDFLQKVPLYLSMPAKDARATMLGMEFLFEKNLGVIDGMNGKVEGSVVYLKDISELKSKDIKDKIVVMVLGDIRASLRNLDRVELIQSAGGVGLIEIFGPGQQFPWAMGVRFLHRERMKIGDMHSQQTLPHVWVRDTSNALIQKFNNNETGMASIDISGISKKEVETYNVVGKIEGTDTDLRQEHVIMCAHYDHVGVQNGEGVDSIYNGARDNAIGTSGLINAARYFGKYPTKRSLVIIALTGEEKGLLGSSYYTNNPKIPLEETVFALNIDNSGYTNTTEITLLDTARTNIDELVYQAASEVGLGVIGDRLPSQNYYERSDQVSFAVKGVPAINFKMSMTAFDERISKYYHQPSDEVENVDLDYIYKYWKSFIRTAELIGNWDQKPYWMEGDKFEPAGNQLYKK